MNMPSCHHHQKGNKRVEIRAWPSKAVDLDTLGLLQDYKDYNDYKEERFSGASEAHMRRKAS
jgi:hypothetical protein